MAQKLDYVIVDLIESTAKNVKTHPLNLGAVPGSGGGVGAPPGGYIGWLPQTRVAYDMEELASLATSVSGSILDNLNHIRYRLNTLESGGSLIITDDNNALSYLDTSEIHFSGAGVIVTDLGGGEVRLTISATGSGGGGFGSNDTHVDQTGGVSDTYGVLAGAVNGVNTTYTVSAASYISGSLLVYLNGQLQTQGTSEDWVEISPSNGTFGFNTAPLTGDLVTAQYMTAASVSGNADTLDGYHAASFRRLTSTLVTITSDYTILTSDEIVLCNNPSGIIVSLPPASGAGNVFNIKSINVGTVVVSGYSTHTIDGYNTKIIDTMYDSITVVDGGTATWYIL